MNIIPPQHIARLRWRFETTPKIVTRIVIHLRLCILQHLDSKVLARIEIIAVYATAVGYFQYFVRRPFACLTVCKAAGAINKLDHITKKIIIIINAPIR